MLSNRAHVTGVWLLEPKVFIVKGRYNPKKPHSLADCVEVSSCVGGNGCVFINCHGFTFDLLSRPQGWVSKVTQDRGTPTYSHVLLMHPMHIRKATPNRKQQNLHWYSDSTQDLGHTHRLKANCLFLLVVESMQRMFEVRGHFRSQITLAQSSLALSDQKYSYFFLRPRPASQLLTINDL